MLKVLRLFQHLLVIKENSVQLKMKSELICIMCVVLGKVTHGGLTPQAAKPTQPAQAAAPAQNGKPAAAPAQAQPAAQSQQAQPPVCFYFFT